MTTSRTFEGTESVYTRELSCVRPQDDTGAPAACIRHRRAGLRYFWPPCAGGGVVVYWYLPSLSIFIASSIATFSSRS